MRMRPGDTFIGEVTNVKSLTVGPDYAQQWIKIITVGFDIPGRMRPYFTTISWNVAKKGRSPERGEKVEIKFHEPPFRSMMPPFVPGRFYPVRIVHTEKETETMAMSRDRVRFYVGPKYLQHDGFYDVLNRAFGLEEDKARRMYRTRDGFTIVCRPSQFARFMIYRNEAGITNGFMDLRADLIEVEDYENPWDLLARTTGVARHDAIKVAESLGFTPKSIRNYLKCNSRVNPNPVVEIDVSQNPHNG